MKTCKNPLSPSPLSVDSEIKPIKCLDTCISEPFCGKFDRFMASVDSGFYLENVAMCRANRAWNIFIWIFY